MPSEVTEKARRALSDTITSAISFRSGHNVCIHQIDLYRGCSLPHPQWRLLEGHSTP